jgi:hypothetical protein
VGIAGQLLDRLFGRRFADLKSIDATDQSYCNKCRSADEQNDFCT